MRVRDMLKALAMFALLAFAVVQAWRVHNPTDPYEHELAGASLWLLALAGALLGVTLYFKLRAKGR